jgi:hydrogenase large subunit
MDLTDADQIQEQVDHSWYAYPSGSQGLHPWDGVTDPKYTGPDRQWDFLDENGKYSWVKAPRWRGNPVEVGPLARMVVGYAGGRPEFVDVVKEALAKLKQPPEVLFSTIGRTLARGLETRLCARWLMAEYTNLMTNISRGVLTTADTSKWNPSTWPATAKGFGFTEAPRGACAHWIKIAGGKIDNYQIVVPSTWNASPKDGKGQRGAYESALLGTPLAVTDQPLEILRTIHSFDPCLACATHVMSRDGRTLAEVVVE